MIGHIYRIEEMEEVKYQYRNSPFIRSSIVNEVYKGTPDAIFIGIDSTSIYREDWTVCYFTKENLFSSELDFKDVFGIIKFLNMNLSEEVIENIKLVEELQ